MYLRTHLSCTATTHLHLVPQAVDLIDRMLVFDPTKRITVEQALEHPYLSSLHDISDEPTCPVPIDFDFDSEMLTPDIVREVILTDVVELHPDLAYAYQQQQQAALGAGPGAGAAAAPA